MESTVARHTGIGVLDKAMAIITEIESGPRTLAQLVQSTGLARATVHRLAAALVDQGMLRRADDGHYHLGLRLVALGRAAADGFPLAEAARPALRRLRDETEESVQLYVRQGDRRVCVLSLESPHGLRTIVPEGASLPLDAGSGGTVLLGADASWVASIAEREPGVASVSAPVRRDGDIVAAVSVSGPIDRIDPDRLGPLVAAAALAIPTAGHTVS